MPQQNKHQLADRLPWNKNAWVRYSEEPPGTPSPQQNKAGKTANNFIARLLALPRR